MCAPEAHASPDYRQVRERFVKPRWEGEDISGKTILLHSEQGFGDTIHFGRYAAKIAKERGGKVIIECYEAIERLLRTVPGVSEVVVAGAVVH